MTKDKMKGLQMVIQERFSKTTYLWPIIERCQLSDTKGPLPIGGLEDNTAFEVGIFRRMHTWCMTWDLRAHYYM